MRTSPSAMGGGQEAAPFLNGSMAVVTGGNRGIGLAVAEALAEQGAQVVLACRDQDAARRAAERIRRRTDGIVGTVAVDLARPSSINHAAGELLERGPIGLLVNNAATGFDRVSAGGKYAAFAVNHLGHFAWTCRLLPGMTAGPGSRVVTVGSPMHWLNRRDPWVPRRSAWGAYAASKEAQHAFSLDLASRLQRAGSAVISVAANPGPSNTGFHRGASGAGGYALRAGARLAGPLLGSAEEGAAPVVYAATSMDVRNGACYGLVGPLQLYGPVGEVPVSPRVQDAELQEALWHVSEAEVGMALDGR